MSSRSFLRRWNLRVLRLEWRQHAVIFCLMLAGVFLSVAGVLAAHNLVEPPESEFGSGQYATWTDGDPALLAAALIDGDHSFGTIESATLRIAGTTQRVDTRSVDPENAVTAPLVSLLDGRWPVGADEVAVTNRAVVDVATVGTRFTLADRDVAVVGVVENPTRLADEFVLVPSLAPFESTDVSTRFLVDADPGVVQYPGVPSVNVSSTSGPALRTAVTMIVNVVSALGMLEIGLLVGAGFAVIARRRMYQFGLLAAAGASPAQLRSTATSAGLLLGASAAIPGAVLGVLGAWLLMPRMEAAVGHRISFGVPWWAVIVNLVVAIVVAGSAARWPARSLATEPVAHLLGAQRPQVASVGRPAVAGVVLTVIGGALLAAGFARLNLLFAVLGVLLAPVGLLLIAPLLVRQLSRGASAMSLAPRLAGRSVGRHNRRSAAVVAALALALAVPIGLTVVTSSIDARRVDEGPNVAANWFIAWQPGADSGTSRIPAQLDGGRLADSTARIAEAVPGLRLVSIEVAVDADAPQEVWDFDSAGFQQSVEPVFAGRIGTEQCLTCDTYGFGQVDEQGNELVWIADEAWVASPAVLEVLGIDPTLLDQTSVALAASPEHRPISSSGPLGDGEVAVSPVWPRNSRIPSLLIAPGLVDDPSFERVSIGVLGVTDGPVSAEMRESIRGAVGPDLILEFHEQPESQSGLRAAALIIGMLIGIGIALAAVSLFTVELADDLRVLHSVGAPPSTIRRLSAAVAAIVAVAGALLALLIGYVALIPLITAKEVDFPFVVPWRALLALLLVFPVIAATAGWLRGRPSDATASPAT